MTQIQKYQSDSLGPLPFQGSGPSLGFAKMFFLFLFSSKVQEVVDWRGGSGERVSCLHVAGHFLAVGQNLRYLFGGEKALPR